MFTAFFETVPLSLMTTTSASLLHMTATRDITASSAPTLTSGVPYPICNCFCALNFAGLQSYMVTHRHRDFDSYLLFFPHMYPFLVWVWLRYSLKKYSKISQKDPFLWILKCGCLGEILNSYNWMSCKAMTNHSNNSMHQERNEWGTRL